MRLVVKYGGAFLVARDTFWTRWTTNIEDAKQFVDPDEAVVIAKEEGAEVHVYERPGLNTESE